MDKIKEAFSRVKLDILELKSQISLLLQQIQEIKRTLNQTDTSYKQTDRQKIQTITLKEEGLKQLNSPISTGNEGVQTDRQTNQQTDSHQQRFALSTITKKIKDPISKLEQVSNALESLDSLKKELRTQFKKLTSQEMLVFSTIYQLDEEGFTADYSLISSKINLSESSIRDYVQKIIKKGIPVVKAKEDNKRIILSIPEEFKKIASLQSIISLRKL
jgi:chromosome segregation ATPase